MGPSKENKSLLWLFLLTYLLPCNCEVPVVQDWPSSITISEDVPVGSVLFNFTVKSGTFNEDITVNTRGSATFNIVNINQNRGNNIFAQVISKTELDRDGYGIPGVGTCTLKFVVIDLRGNTINLETKLYLRDVNDNTPRLENRPYQWIINEHSQKGNETFTNVKATDLDDGFNGNLGIRFKMEPLAKSAKLASEYAATFNMDPLTGVITLHRMLDYENHSVYHFNITATDEKGKGRTSDSTILTITVDDVQDTPPIFTSGSYKAFVRNDAEVNTQVITVHAIDGDTGYRPMNAMGYYISPGRCSELFSINDQGEVNTRLRIDTNTDDFDPACELTVVAQEVDADQSQQYGPIKTEATVYVVLGTKETHSEFERRCSSGGSNLSIVISVQIVGTLLVTLLLGI
ncbi:cadherin-87A-like [Ruditapes philippinarum]|uniref:cadherin-87A-like n=1 Tax=Ruditapes philippinarum TaxID=129788 RepID=UPI00295BDA7B|nr:cadherin-87A-like [Ruditapes philippinarum]